MGEPKCNYDEPERKKTTMNNQSRQHTERAKLEQPSKESKEQVIDGPALNPNPAAPHEQHSSYRYHTATITN